MVSAITGFELLRGVERRPEAMALAVKVETFLARVATLPFDEAAVASATRLDGLLHRAGMPIGGLDTLIAGRAALDRARIPEVPRRGFTIATALDLARHGMRLPGAA